MKQGDLGVGPRMAAPRDEGGRRTAMTGRTRLGRRTLPLVLAVGAIVASTCFAAASASAATTVSVSVDGNHLVNAEGQTVRLLGVDRSGPEYACEEGWGIFDGPSNAALWPPWPGGISTPSGSP